MNLAIARARALWWSKQALGRERGGSLIERAASGARSTPEGERGLIDRIAATGWLRTLGGADVYLAARARWPGMTRAELDAAVAADALVVRPAARGCIYLVPPSVVPDLIADNFAAWKLDTEKSLAKAGVKMGVVESLAPAVLATLKAGPLDTNAIRKALPAGAVPSFGEAGKKAGVSSPLPLALRLLELGGKISRTLEGGKLDTDRYLWRADRAKPVAGDKDAVRRLAHLVDIFLGFAGPATLGNLAAWTGRSQRDLKVALALTGAVEVAVEGLGEAWLRAGDAREAGNAPEPRGIALLAFEDNYLVAHGLGAVTDRRHHDIEIDIFGGGGKPQKLGAADHVLSRTIVIDGLIAGFWEVDPSTGGGAWSTFYSLAGPVTEAIDDLVGETSRFLLGEIGHARSFTLDTMDDVQLRADAIKKLKKPKPKRPA